MLLKKLVTPKASICLMPTLVAFYRQFTSNQQILIKGLTKPIKKTRGLVTRELCLGMQPTKPKITCHWHWIYRISYCKNLPSCAENLKKLLICVRSEEHTSELQSRPHLVCRLLLEKKKR